MAANRFRCIEFEIYGRVQNVWMRKHVIEAGKFFGVTGYCFNTDNTTLLPSQNPSKQKCTGTVRGEACGELEAVESFEEYIKGRWRKAEPPYPKLARIDACILLKDSKVAENPFDAFRKKKVILANGTQWAS
eukprot:INCI3002.1.p1 GENE.INCI3002.1~~INCI3002.1.p1  ORF type:complete len:153 (+),score=25.54 INCI3002.1:66-461(+)